MMIFCQDPSYGCTDVGGAYVGPTQRRIARMANQLGLSFYRVEDSLKTVINVKVMLNIGCEKGITFSLMGFLTHLYPTLALVCFGIGISLYPFIQTDMNR